MDLNVVEPISEALKTFHTKEEFNRFYQQNKEKLDAITTHKLNKMYHIEGYHITKLKAHEGLSLKKWEGPRYIKNDDMNKLEKALTLSEQALNVSENVQDLESKLQEQADMMDNMEAGIAACCKQVSAVMKECEEIQSLKKQVEQLSIQMKNMQSVKDELDKLKTKMKNLFNYLDDNGLQYK
jgi:hypothetical protein